MLKVMLWKSSKSLVKLKERKIFWPGVIGMPLMLFSSRISLKSGLSGGVADEADSGFGVGGLFAEEDEFVLGDDDGLMRRE